MLGGKKTMQNIIARCANHVNTRSETDHARMLVIRTRDAADSGAVRGRRSPCATRQRRPCRSSTAAVFVTSADVIITTPAEVGERSRPRWVSAPVRRGNPTPAGVVCRPSPRWWSDPCRREVSTPPSRVRAPCRGGSPIRPRPDLRPQKKNVRTPSRRGPHACEAVCSAQSGESPAWGSRTTRKYSRVGSTLPRTCPDGLAATAWRKSTVSAVISSPGRTLGIPGG